MEQLYTRKEVAKLAKVSVQAIVKWEKEGKIKVVRFNGQPRIAESELKRIMKED